MFWTHSRFGVYSWGSRSHLQLSECVWGWRSWPSWEQQTGGCRQRAGGGGGGGDGGGEGSPWWRSVSAAPAPSAFRKKPGSRLWPRPASDGGLEGDQRSTEFSFQASTGGNLCPTELLKVFSRLIQSAFYHKRDTFPSRFSLQSARKNLDAAEWKELPVASASSLTLSSECKSGIHMQNCAALVNELNQLKHIWQKDLSFQKTFCCNKGKSIG